jgi:catechol 2,3-dioxygenase-like lactoylglutathione lyase family enzyme
LPSRDILRRIDHLIYATPDLESSVDYFEDLLGVHAVEGGSHAAWGTRNALMALGDVTYLEIIGPDPGIEPQVARPFGLDRLSRPRLVTWAANAKQLEDLAEKAKAFGIELGQVLRGSRVRSDGVVLQWKMTDLLQPRHDGIVPFFIDWGDAWHPAATSVQSGELLHLRAVHPHPEVVGAALRALGLELPLETGPVPALSATIRTLEGAVVEIS